MGLTSTSAIASGGIISYSLPADLRAALRQSLKEWDAANKTERLWKGDCSLWPNSDESQCLDWLDVVERQLQDLSKYKALAAEVEEDGFTHLVVLSADGSGVAPQALRHTSHRQSGCLQLTVLDSTQPLQVSAVRSQIDPGRSLFCVSSRSANCLGTGLLAGYFFEETARIVGGSAEQHFIAIASAESLPGALLSSARYRHVYSGQSNFSASYLAFSDFGLVPHAAAGHDTEKLLKGAKRMMQLSRNTKSRENPGVVLGLLLGTAAAKCRRDKVTLVCSPSVHALGSWIEQSLAESAERQGQGVVPVFEEPLVDVDCYRSDRIFVYVKYTHDNDRELERHISQLEDRGQAVVRLPIEELNELGQIVFQWQVATAVIGALQGIDPFRMPEIQIAGSSLQETSTFGSENLLISQGDISLFGDEANAAALIRHGDSVGGVIRRHLDRLGPQDYFALLAYIPRFPKYEQVLQNMRREVLESKQTATALGFGPSCLNVAERTSAGRTSGVILQITCENTQDLSTTGSLRGFSEITARMARNDFQTLAERGCRILRVHVKSDLAAGLDQLRNLVCAAIEH